MSNFQFYTLIAIAFLFILIIYFQLKKKKDTRRLKQKLADKWGKIPDGKYRNEDMKAISTYFENQSEINKDEFFIDDITWNDLEMDNVYKRINSATSTQGEEFLYTLLRKPVFDEKELVERDRVIKYFSEDSETRKKIQVILSSPGINRYSGASNILFSNRKIKTKRSLYVLMALTFTILLFYTIFISAQSGLLFLLASFFINMTVYNKEKTNMAAELDSMSHIVRLISCANKLSRIKSEALENYTVRLRECVNKLRGVNMRSFYVLYSSQDPITEYMKTVLLVELISYDSSIKFISKNLDTIRTLYETIGFIDSMISIASYRESLDYYSIPSLIQSSAKETKILSFTDAYHPLISRPVPNSLAISSAILITGSNASGKSTFLKTVAINSVFSQTIFTCLAKEYRSSLYMIYSSMALRDNLSSNESYYIAEVKSLKRVFDSLNEAYPLLCLIDEVLRGTNTIERIAASSEVLNSLGASNCLCIAATHDIELTSILKNRCTSFHFQEHFEDNEIVFDYKIYPGSSTTRNAIKLLEVIGYDDSLVKAAGNRAENFMKEGKWQIIQPV